MHYMPRGYCGIDEPAEEACFICNYNPVYKDKNGEKWFCLDCPSDRNERLAEASSCKSPPVG